MVIKNGYKETEIGIIPIEWDCVNLGEKSNIFRGGSPRPIQDFITNDHNGINWIKIGDVKKDAKYIETTNEKIKHSGISRSRQVFIGDFVISNSMSFGRPYILKLDGCIHDGWLVIQNYENNFQQQYLYYALSSNYVTEQYISMAAGSSVQNLNKDKVSSVFLCKPSKEEQTAIATALSDIDTLIENLEKLIEKKKNIKQGAMEDLLTGKERLEGLNGEWEEKTLEELCYLITKQTGFDYTTTIKPSLVNKKLKGELPFIQNKDFQFKTINYNTDFYIPYNVALMFPQILLNEICLLISISGKIGNVAIFENQMLSFIGGAVGICKFKDIELVEWCMLYLSSKLGQMQILSKEKVGAQRNLTIEDVRKLKIKISKDKKEMTGISAILSDMDTEITQLQEKLSKYQQIKVGMMEELLTGKIRLIGTVADTVTASAVKDKGHNQQFDDAIMISAIVNAFYSPTYPLGRKKMQKLLYLTGRKKQCDISAFHKHAAGPYADSVRYKGGEPIAKKNGYVAETKSKKGSSFSKGKNMDKALVYISDWNRQGEIDWLVSNFKYTKVDELEVLATVDMAICDLKAQNKAVTVDAIKALFKNEKEWVDKLNKTYFSDIDIQNAINKLSGLFGEN